MRNPFNFFIELIQQPPWILIWVFYLMVINMASLAFWHEPLAKLIIVTFIISAILMMGLYSRFGFEKILGLGHILWVLLLIYILMKLQAPESLFDIYLIILSVSITISLAFDITDAWRYITNRNKI